MRRPIWIIGIAILAIIIILIGISTFLRQPDDALVAEMQITPRSVGVSVPTDGVGTDPTPVPEAIPEAPSTPLEPGQVVTVAADNSGVARVYADADPQSQLMDVYQDLASVTILEPSGDYESYPVTVGEGHWYRVRGPDGLVGWMQVANLSSE